LTASLYFLMVSVACHMARVVMILVSSPSRSWRV
jgi:hypothetical protein